MLERSIDKGDRERLCERVGEGVVGLADSGGDAVKVRFCVWRGEGG